MIECRRMPRAKLEQPSLFVESAESQRSSAFQSGELPEGFLYRPSLLTEAEQCDLLDSIKTLKFRPFDFHGFQAKRRVIEFGYHYDFDERSTTAADPIPAFLLPVRSKAAESAGVPAEDLVEGIITEYPPGAPIGWHRDVPQFEIVIGVSLASSCRMRLKPIKGGKIAAIALEPGSMYVMRGPARWQYQHSIPAVKELRYSVTLRTLRKIESPSRQNKDR
jgi:alkylated DNA repair dioxygenase AlkB